MASTMQLTVIFVIAAVAVKGITCSSPCPATANMITMDDIRNAVKGSEQAYNARLVVGNKVSDSNFEVFKIFEVDEDSEDDDNTDTLRVIIADNNSTNPKQRMIAYRGTNTKSQLDRQTSSFTWTPRSRYHVFGGRNVSVGRFFFDGFEKLQPDVKPWLQSTSFKYIITGHSLGGAMASILAIKMTDEYFGSIWNNPKSALITFGQPRTGWYDYATLHDELVSTWRKLRITHWRDIVPVLPPPPLTLYQHSRAFYLGYEHATTKRRRRTKRKESKNNKLSNKRLLFSCEWTDKYYTSTKLWQICGTGEADACTRQSETEYGCFYDDHKIINYKNMIVGNPPSKIRNKDGEKKNTLTEAIQSSCPTTQTTCYNGANYYISNVSKTWYAAEHECKFIGGHLTSIHSAEENDFFAEKIHERYSSYETDYQEAWIGLNDRTTEGHFVWTDGTPVDFTAWESTRPNGGRKANCVDLYVFHTSKKWYDESCYTKKGFICKL